MSLKGAIAVNRFGLGARSGDINRVSRAPADWLMSQIETKRSNTFDAKSLTPSQDIFRLAETYKREVKALTGPKKAKATKAFQKQIRDVFQAEVLARERHAALTEASFHERLTRFWSNHFSISARNSNTRIFAGAYEREAIRPNILGNFSDLAQSAILHPAMLIYLDNFNSIGPGSPRGQKRERGINENLAREALELHTVTPTANYNQSDVTEFAKALTGWTIGRKPKDKRTYGKTVFYANSHEPGDRFVLGAHYNQSGKTQAIAVLKTLCGRPETARNIAFKLARHFVSDTPPQTLVTKLADTFMQTGGDLKAVYRTLIRAPEAWQAKPQKIKTPEELIVSTARIVGVKTVFSKRVRDSYVSLAQSPFEAPTPEGWPDTSQAWIGPDSILKRIEWANALASHLPDVDARRLLKKALGESLSNETLMAVSNAQSGHQALVLALMSPEFQRR